VANKRYVVKLSDDERKRLSGLISKGKGGGQDHPESAYPAQGR
jgi:hypothetical protein